MVWLCSSANCSERSKLSKGAVCPLCGSPALEYGFVKSISHLGAKSKLQTGKEKKVDALLSSEMSDQEIEDSIYRDIRALSLQESILEPMELSEILDEDEEDSLPAQLLRILVDQNKIVIRQNELILRALGKRAPPRKIAATAQ